MTMTETWRVLDDLAAAWSSHSVDDLLALVTDDCVYEDVTFGAINRGKAELRAFAESVFAGVPDFRIESKTKFGAGDMAGMEWQMSGIHRGDFPGLPATGKTFSIRGVSIVELRSGRIRRVSDYWDAAGLMRQVGLLSGG